MAANDESQSDLIERLIFIIPEFEAEWADWCSEDGTSSTSLHAVYIAFFPLLAGSSVSEKQLRQFADLANAAVSAGGNAENAVSTCILEHLSNSALLKKLRPYLSKDARERVSAYFVLPGGK